MMFRGHPGRLNFDFSASKACWLRAILENGPILFPAKHVGDYSIWQALLDELLLFPQGEHDDLFDGLQTMVEGALSLDYGPMMTFATGNDKPDNSWPL